MIAIIVANNPPPSLTKGLWIAVKTKSCIFPNGVNENIILTTKKNVRAKAGTSAENDFNTAGGTLSGSFIVQPLKTAFLYNSQLLQPLRYQQTFL